MRPAARVAVVAVAGLIAVGSISLYFYTSKPTSANSSASNDVTKISAFQPSMPPVGYQDPSGLPQGAWARYLGFIPPGYVLAPNFHAGIIPCPKGMNLDQCHQFLSSCANGVCDPNESSISCPIDCVVPGQLTCDPYTLRAGAPTGPCQVNAVFPGNM